MYAPHVGAGAASGTFFILPSWFCILKILILKPSSLGDVVQALPVLRLLKRRFPDGEIH